VGATLSIVETVAYHHSPEFVTDGPVDVLAAVHVADALLNAQMKNKGRTSAMRDSLDYEFISESGSVARWTNGGVRGERCCRCQPREPADECWSHRTQGESLHPVCRR